LKEESKAQSAGLLVSFRDCNGNQHAIFQRLWSRCGKRF